MTRMLAHEDALALDLLLDRAPASATEGLRYAAANVASDRVRGVEQVLSVLGTLPEPEPPQDLVARTLRFVDRAAGEGGALRGGLPAILSTPRPQM